MKSRIILLISVFVLISSIAFYAKAGGGYTLENQRSIAVVQDSGDKAYPLLICLSSQTATKLVDSSTTTVNRSVSIQNPIGSGYNIAIGTSPTFSYSTARLAELAPSGSISSFGGFPLYGIIAPGGSGVCIIGGREWKEGDDLIR